MAAFEIIWDRRRDGFLMQSLENVRIAVLKTSNKFQEKNLWWCMFFLKF